MAENLVIECPSADLKEAAYFKRMSRVWWDLKGEYREQYYVDSAVVPYMVQRIINVGLAHEEFAKSEKPLKGLNILEVGSGGGILCELLSKYGGDITGIDVNISVMDVAKNHLQQDPTITNVKYFLQSVEQHVLENAEKYDLVILNTVIHHISDPCKEPFLNCCVKCLKPGGSIFVSGCSKTWASWLVNIILFEMLGIAPRGTSDYDKFITIENLEIILKRCQCKLVATQGIGLNTFSHTWSFRRSCALLYISHFVKELEEKNDN